MTLLRTSRAGKNHFATRLSYHVRSDCLNEEQRRKDAFDRQATVEHLREQLKRGEKSLIGNKGYALYPIMNKENLTISFQLSEYSFSD